MKRWALLLLFLLLAVAFFAFIHYKPMAKQENHWSLFRTDEVCFLSIPIQNIDYSPILSAVFLTHLQDNDLDLTFNFSVINARQIQNDDSIYCVLEYKGLELESVIGQLQCSEVDENYLYSGKYTYNIAKLLSQKSELELLEWMKMFPTEVTPLIKFVGTQSELKVYRDNLR